ncbi:MAG: DUF5103 domain-containing protein [Bacteroidales bacterium]
MSYKRMNPLVLFTLLTLITFILKPSFSQETDSIDYIYESNRAFKKNIKTILLHRDGWELSPPLIIFNSDEKLKLSFDDLDSDVKEFLYTIVHCDASWKPSDMRQDEYMDGYYEDYINDYSFSLNTIQPYTHYELIFPTDDLIPKVSGNYILKVFVDNPDSVFFTRRFFLTEKNVNIEASVRKATLIEDSKYKQELDFSINTSGYSVLNPYTDIKVSLVQNGRWDNAIMDLKPKMVVNDKLDYNYDKENVFDGGSEFRSFDTKSLSYYTEYIAKIDYTGEGYDVTLQTDERKTFRIYKREDDINGRLKIKTEDHNISETEAEYLHIHFFLTYPAPMVDADIFIIGQLTDWNFSDESKMDYNFKRKGYEKTLLLKQGYYNYQYILRYRGQSMGDVSFIEGNHWETENQYTIMVYNRESGKYYDRLVGVKHFNSIPD